MQELYKIEGNKIFAKKIGDEFVELPSLENENLLGYYQEEFVKFEKESKKVFEKIEATENRGSYLAKIILLSDQIKNLDAIGDFDSIYHKLEGYKKSISESVESNRKRNSEIKQSLTESLAKIVEENNWRAIEDVKELNQKWIRVGRGVDSEDAQLNEKYESLRTEFFSQKKEFFDSQKELIESRIQIYREIIKQIEDITESKDFKTKRPQVDRLVEDWKQNGAIPKSSYDVLFTLYKKTLDAYYEKLKQIKKTFSSANEQNNEILAKKKQVLDSLKAYLQNTSRYETRAIHKIKDEWNLAGKVNGKVLGKIGDEFYSDIEFLYEFANLQSFQEKKNYGLDNNSMIKTIKRFIQENESEIDLFKTNQEQMQIKLSSDNINMIFRKRLQDLERKLLAKQRILKLLEN